MSEQQPIAPRQWTAPPADVLLSDGRIAGIRSLRAEDRDAVLALHESVSENTLRLRFFSANRSAARAYVTRLFDDEHDDATALIAFDRGRVIGLATAEVFASDAAEVAFLVSDADRGRGLGSLLLEHLAALGRRHGVRRFEADVLAENSGMLRVFRGAGFAETRRHEGGEVLVQLDTDESADAIAAADRREWRSQARSLRPLLQPESIAVVGVRRSAGGFGFGILDAIRSSSYSGAVHVVHPEAEQIDGLPVHPTLAAIGSPVDLVVIAVPRDGVSAVLRDAAATGAGAVLIVSSGFAEHEGDHADRAADAVAELRHLARAHGVRMVGPNSQGVLGNAAGLGLNATFLRDIPDSGGLGVVSQSGGMGFALLDLARDIGLGIHAFVSLGDKLDVSSNDLLAAWMDDDRVSAGALYLESFGNALKFARTARAFAERKPLLAVIGGRSRARLERAHDGASAPIGVDALLTQSGVIACRTGADLTETALLLDEQPLPEGLRVGIISNTGGLGALAMDLIDAQGLAVTALSHELQQGLRSTSTGLVDARNPIDLGADVTPDALAACVDRLAGSGEVDAVVVLLVTTRLGDRDELFAAVGRGRAGAPGTPVLLVAPGAAAVAARGTPGVTVFRTIEAATGALARAMRYAEWRRVPPDQPVVDLGTRAAHARSWAAARLVEQGGDPHWLPTAAMTELLSPYGIQLLGRLAQGVDEAVRAATDLGFPVVVKLADPTEPHKTERGLVRVDLRSAAAVEQAVAAIATELGRDQVEVLVQPLLLGHQVSVSVLRDPELGPLVRLASGGQVTDHLDGGSRDDAVVLMPPIGPADAARAVRALRLWPRVVGSRGPQAVDAAELESLVAQVGQLAVDVPQLAALALDPLVLTTDGLRCVDVKARLALSAEMDAGLPRQLRS